MALTPMLSGEAIAASPPVADTAVGAPAAGTADVDDIPVAVGNRLTTNQGLRISDDQNQLRHQDRINSGCRFRRRGGTGSALDPARYRYRVGLTAARSIE